MALATPPGWAVQGADLDATATTAMMVAVSVILTNIKSCQQFQIQSGDDIEAAGSSSVKSMGGGSTADVRAALGFAGWYVMGGDEELLVI